MARFCKTTFITVLIFIITCLFNYNVLAETDSDLNISVDISSQSTLKGDSLTVGLSSNRDVVINEFSEIDWQYTSYLDFELEDCVSDAVSLHINTKENLLILSFSKDVRINSGEIFAKIKITPKSNAILGKYVLGLLNISIFDENYVEISSTCEDINLEVVSEELVPTPGPTNIPAPTAGPTDAPTLKPTSKPSGNTNNSTDPTSTPTVTPSVSTSPAPTSTPEATMAPTSSPSGQIFGDVAEDYWAYSYIMDLYANNIVNGDKDGNFYPENNVTRAEFTKMAVSLFQIESLITESAFTDVPADEWYAEYVAAAAEAGIVTGTSETTFSPDETVTREQMATIIGRKLNLTSETDSEYADADIIADYALGYVTGLTEAGYLTGDDSGMFRPQATATRAESATLLSRVRTSNTAE